MAKRKHPKLPNGFGSIKKLSGNRTNPYAVHPPTTEYTDDAIPITPKAICYLDDWYKGFYVLLALKNGTFSEKTIEEISVAEIGDGHNQYDVVSKIIAAYNRSARVDKGLKTFAEVYEGFYNHKFNGNKEYAEATKRATKSAFNNCKDLHNKVFKSLSQKELQEVVDGCKLKYASKEHIINLYRQMYTYAEMENLCDKNYAQYVTINTPDDDEKGVPFSEEELNLIWDNQSHDPILQCILIMIYSGYRIAAYSQPDFVIDLENGYFQGGVKTLSSKNRIVPIHPIIKSFVDQDLKLFTVTPTEFRKLFSSSLNSIGIRQHHTPHDCRHTFAWLCDRYGVETLSKKLLLGHSLGNDITDSVYGHRTFEELVNEISKIKHW